MLKLCSCFKSNSKKNTDFGIFLSGDDESGKTKMIEELVDAHDPFTRGEKILKTSEIERYLRDSLTDILCAFKQCGPGVQLEYPEDQWRIAYILRTANEINFEYPLEFFEHVELLWADAGLQAFLKRSNKYRLSDTAKYFLDRVNKINDPDYIPTTEDMIYSRLFPSNVFQMSFDLSKERVRFNVLEMDFLREEQQELIQSFADKTNVIIFITDCSYFDVMTGEKECQTRLHQSLDLYKMIRNNKLLETIPVILLLNKQDLLAEKIKNGVRLEDYFPEFADYVLPDRVNPGEDPEVTRAKYFIEHQFIKVNPNNCYNHFTCDSDITVRLIFDDCRKI